MDTPDQIVDAALDAFYREGFHATGVDRLSAVAGVTKRTLYRHFPSKEHLIAAALRLRDERFMARMEAFMAGFPLPMRPLAYLDFLSAWGKEPDFHGCAFINAAAEFADPAEQPHAIAKAHKLRVLDYLGQLCREAGAEDAAAVAKQLFLVGEGLIVAMQVMGHSDALVESGKAMMGIALPPGT